MPVSLLVITLILHYNIENVSCNTKITFRLSVYKCTCILLMLTIKWNTSVNCVSNNCTLWHKVWISIKKTSLEEFQQI